MSANLVLRRAWQRDCCEFEASLDYIMSSRPADATDRNLPQKTQQQEQKLYGVSEYTNSLQVLNVKKK